jgi:hypothetical protein
MCNSPCYLLASLSPAILIALPAAALTGLVAWWVARNLRFPLPPLFTACVAMLAFLGLLQFGEAVLLTILLPYAALALALLGALLLGFFIRLFGLSGRSDGRQSGESKHEPTRASVKWRELNRPSTERTTHRTTSVGGPITAWPAPSPLRQLPTESKLRRADKGPQTTIQAPEHLP